MTECMKLEFICKKHFTELSAVIVTNKPFTLNAVL